MNFVQTAVLDSLFKLSCAARKTQSLRNVIALNSHVTYSEKKPSLT